MLTPTSVVLRCSNHTAKTDRMKVGIQANQEDDDGNSKPIPLLCKPRTTKPKSTLKAGASDEESDEDDLDFSEDSNGSNSETDSDVVEILNKEVNFYKDVLLLFCANILQLADSLPSKTIPLTGAGSSKHRKRRTSDKHASSNKCSHQVDDTYT